MGTGSSKARTLTVNTNFNAKENLHVEQHSGGSSERVTAEGIKDDFSRRVTESENISRPMDLPVSSDEFNVKTVANFQVLKKENEVVVTTNDRQSVTQRPEYSSDLPSLLSSFGEKHPAAASTLKTIYDHYKALEDALNNGNLSSVETLAQVKGLFNVYLKDKTRKNRQALTEFAAALGIPKLAHQIIVDQRSKHQGLTTWDTENDEGKTIERTEENGTEGIETRVEGESDENQDHVDGKGQKEALKMSQGVVSQLLAALLNFSDLSDTFCMGCDESGMVHLLVNMTKEMQDSIAHNVKYVNSQTQQLTKYTVRGKMLSRVMGILHNMSKRVPIRRSFAACQALDVLIPLLKAEIVLYSTKSLLVLAYLIDEENNHLIMTDEDPIKFLTGLLVKALARANHRYFGFSAAELAEGLTQIAINDNNKKTIAKCGAIPVLVTMLQKAKDDDERLNASQTLWILAFDDENRNEIKNNESAIAELQKLVLSENTELKRAAAGALWECQGKQKHEEAKQMTVTVQGVSDCKHVMISYQWDVQKSMIQLRNQLQSHGYKVWMDIDEMGGSTLESMARAVENASVVLVGVSQKYKESPNCRSEAEYTFQLHKDIIPLMMDYRYKPDGWLGLIVGSKFWIDFSDRHKVDTNVDKLIKELGGRGKTAQEETIHAVAVDFVDACPQTSIRSWTNKDVIKWLREVGLEGRLDSKAMQRLNGQILLRLQDLRKESPEFFYTSIRTDLKLANVFDVMEFADELDKLE